MEERSDFFPFNMHVRRKIDGLNSIKFLEVNSPRNHLERGISINKN